LIDARTQRRFVGLDPEPRPNLNGGHYPQSKNFPYDLNYEIKEGTNWEVYLDENKLKEKMKESKLDFEKPSWFACGSGITACNNILSFYLLGNDNLAVYDGSWAEYGMQKFNNPVEK